MLSIEDKQLPMRLTVDVKMLEERACFNSTFPSMERPLATCLHPTWKGFGRSLVGDANKLGPMSSLRDTPRLFTLLASGEMFERTGNITLWT